MEVVIAKTLNGFYLIAPVLQSGNVAGLGVRDEEKEQEKKAQNRSFASHLEEATDEVEIRGTDEMKRKLEYYNHDGRVKYYGE